MSIRWFGGTPGLRDEGLLESALARARNRAAYADPSVYELAASCGEGLIRNYPFVDGNKRIGGIAIRLFLFQNGIQFEPEVSETITVIQSLAAGELDTEALIAWIEANSTPR